jgi:hypothetical protein
MRGNTLLALSYNEAQPRVKSTPTNGLAEWALDQEIYSVAGQFVRAVAGSHPAFPLNARLSPRFRRFDVFVRFLFR